MKPFILLLVCLCFAVPINGQKSNQISDQVPKHEKDDDEIANECFDKFFYNLDTIAKHYKFRVLESSQSTSFLRHDVDYKETLYEYRQIQDIMMRRDISSNKIIYDSDKKFHPYSKEFDINRSFFERFHYKFKGRKQTNDGSAIIMSFTPKRHLEEKHLFDRTINALVGEIEIRESDMALLAFRAHLPEEVNVEYGKPPTAGLVVTSASVVFETEQLGNLVVAKSANIIVDYDTRLLTRTFSNQNIRKNEYQGYDKLEVSNETSQEVSWEVSNDHDISDSIWTKKKIALFLGIVIGVPVFLIWFLLKIRKNRFFRQPS